MARFLLIHGSCHGAWCWSGVIAALAHLGHEAKAIDLPAHGADPTPAAAATLDLYAEAILAAIYEPVTLVGHSAGGYPITLAAERAPEKITRLVYLCAYVPAPGLSMIEMRRAGPSQPLAGAVHADPDGISYRIDPEKARATFFHDCSETALAHALARLCPEPIAPQSTALPPLRHWPSVEKHYIRCDDDHAIPPDYQTTMSAGFPATHVSALPTGHSPFLSAPALLARRLDEIARNQPLIPLEGDTSG
ncbi:alpha/beta fold hydrolase [Defluviimonas sp. D31]|uniref:alpha/beta fold hydrolase n=1 Tax=Defluviimonas sp. D31 TaxID=3083253 RepID=UPI00296EA3C8|nr:alpha/beta fold hydrolase [Defluviimonas sp. D31]MDW4550652.1 alpha/beta fold hydrolase [Defluviimonas sp. D31]